MLILRGTCFFVEKTVHAEAAGAVAVIIINTGDGTVGMVSSSDAEVHIPTVMVSHEDGNAMKATLDAGREVVMVTLHSPTTRPTTLVNGIPQETVSAAGHVSYFTFSVHHANAVPAVTI